MKMEIRMIGTGLLAAGLLAGTVLAGGPDKEGEAGKARERPEKPEMCKDKGGDADAAERNEFRQAQQERMKAHWEAQRDAWQKVMQSVKSEEDPHKALALLRAHRVAQREKNVAFHEAQREQILKRMAAEHEERKAEADARYAEMLVKLDQLAAKTDLTKEDIRAALRDSMDGMREHKGKQGMERKRERKDKQGMERRRERKEKEDVEQKPEIKAAPDA